MSAPAGPTVDVVITSYNYGRFLGDAIRSSLQDDVDVRVIVVDNASTDDSVEVVRRIAAQDRRVTLVARPENIGFHASANDGIDRITADYAVILCADDMLAPGALGRAIRLMEERRDVALTFGRAAIFTDALPGVGPDDLTGRWRIQTGPDFVRRCCSFARMPCLMSTVIVRTSALKRAGYFDRAFTHTTDFELWLRVALYGDVAESTAVQGFTRIHGANLQLDVTSAYEWNLHLQEMFDYFFNNAGRTLPQARQLSKLARRSLGERAYWSALAHAARGDLATARKLAAYAATHAPLSLVVPPLSKGITRFAAIRRIAASLGWDLRHT
jgi:GT2 family glycosyltransferase